MRAARVDRRSVAHVISVRVSRTGIVGYGPASLAEVELIVCRASRESKSRGETAESAMSFVGGNPSSAVVVPLKTPSIDNWPVRLPVQKVLSRWKL